MKLANMKGMFYMVIVLMLLYSIGIYAQETGEKVLEDFIMAIGGKAAFEKIDSTITTSTLELPNKNFKIKSTTYRMKPNLFYMVYESANGKGEQGFDGTVVWRNSPQYGYQVMEREEAWIQINFASLNFVKKWRDILEKVQLDGEEVFEGQPCHVVTMTSKNGPSITVFFSKKSKLIIRMKYFLYSSIGRLHHDIYDIKYKKFKNVLMPIESKIKMLGKDFTNTVHRIKINVKIPKDRFELPPSIRALLKNHGNKNR